MMTVQSSGLGRIAYERWREALGIPLEFAWARLPHITQQVWERVAQAVLEAAQEIPCEEGGDAS